MKRFLNSLFGRFFKKQDIDREEHGDSTSSLEHEQCKYGQPEHEKHKPDQCKAAYDIKSRSRPFDNKQERIKINVSLLNGKIVCASAGQLPLLLFSSRRSRNWMHLNKSLFFTGKGDDHLSFYDLISAASELKDFVDKSRRGSSKSTLSPSISASNTHPRSVDQEKNRHSDRKKPKWSIDQFDVPVLENETRFHDLNIPINIMHAVCDLGFKYCTPVQAQVLPHTLAGKDATAKAQTGTGKSAAFLISLIAGLMRRPLHGKRQKGAPRALILAPTRELVIQIEKDARALTKYNQLKTFAVFGGTAYKQQHDILENRYVDIVAATPGRLIDFMGQKVINLNKVEMLVLDEADRMLDMGFLPDIRKIIYATPHKDKRQTMFFSATLSPEILRLASQWTNDAVQIEIDPDHAASDNIKQKVYIVTENQKITLLYNLITDKKLDRVILFVNRRDTTRRVARKLRQYGLENGVLSGEVSQNQRMKTLEGFKKGRLKILVATDVAARGLHIEGVSHVINYDLPQEAEHYVHRIGRTGRAGAKGISVSFADEMSSFHIPDIEAVLGEKMDCEYPEESLLKPLPPPLKIEEPIDKKSQRQPRKSSAYKKSNIHHGNRRRVTGKNLPRKRESQKQKEHSKDSDVNEKKSS
ncbi:ATP-dependent RNA helicase rhlB (modular protein) [Desulfamplus magnetovallimortis]|uniref:ATP-dependent RNA helicase rhlB (Modular protein) n=1 Tax=Desulfamplus magnetovallimortis TaxID=1246637 RepID=A0A1W1HBC6_9BACT|nr:DEAD/DEAH box helicase [Desulfamplus magnetovallimortis]SLM29743.1 ATP-dependent RNA helicase rhlB (modular protein) [Desulfamplus magnetovallimortis]